MSAHTLTAYDHLDWELVIEVDYSPAEEPKRGPGGNWVYPGCPESWDVVSVTLKATGKAVPLPEWVNVGELLTEHFDEMRP